ncbi:hypothetical protein JXA80_01245, partial [bacterium]|nr:hypothetical protein [candidate division CSSED10-310 bacterium]
MKRILSITSLFLLIAAGAHGVWTPLVPGASDGDSPIIMDMSVSDAGTVFDVSIPGIDITELDSGQGVFQELAIPSAGWLRDTGAPQVPVIRKNIIVPMDGTVSLDITVNRTTSLDNVNALPAQPSTKRTEEKPPFQIDARIYQSDSLYPSTWGRIVEDSILRDFRFVTIELN